MASTLRGRSEAVNEIQQTGGSSSTSITTERPCPQRSPMPYADLVDDTVVATIGTINSLGQCAPDGRPDRARWHGLLDQHDDDSVKHKNMRDRPDVTLIWYDPKNPYRYVSVRGRAVAFVEGADAARVRIRITPDHVIAYG